MNFLVAAVTKLPPIKVPYSRGHQGPAPLVRDLRGTGWEREGEALFCCLTQIFLAAAGMRVQ